VLGRTPIDIPPQIAAKVTHSSETPEALYARLSAAGAKRLYIAGGITIQRFLAADLITDLTITLISRIIGEGIPLFSPLQQDISLTHTETISYPLRLCTTQVRDFQLILSHIVFLRT
jgi:dihydrofolate reductase